jgi:hypothetical protein
VSVDWSFANRDTKAAEVKKGILVICITIQMIAFGVNPLAKVSAELSRRIQE